MKNKHMRPAMRNTHVRPAMRNIHVRPAMRKLTVAANYWNGDIQALEVERLTIRGYEEVFSFSQNRFSYILDTSMPNFKLQSTRNYLFCSKTSTFCFCSIFKYHKTGMGRV